MRTEFHWLGAPRFGHDDAPQRYALLLAPDGDLWLLGDLPHRTAAYGDPVFGHEGHFVMRLGERVRRRRGCARRDWRASHVGFGEGHLTDVTPVSERRGVAVVTRDGLEEPVGYAHPTFTPFGTGTSSAVSSAGDHFASVSFPGKLG